MDKECLRLECLAHACALGFKGDEGLIYGYDPEKILEIAASFYAFVSDDKKSTFTIVAKD